MFSVRLAYQRLIYKQIVRCNNLTSAQWAVTRQIRSLAGPRGKRSSAQHDEDDRPVRSFEGNLPNQPPSDFKVNHIPEKLRNKPNRDIDKKFESLLGVDKSDRGSYVESPYGLIRFDKPVEKSEEQQADEHRKEPARKEYDLSVFDSQLSSTSQNSEDGSFSKAKDEYVEVNYKPENTSSLKPKQKSFVESERSQNEATQFKHKHQLKSAKHDLENFQHLHTSNTTPSEENIPNVTSSHQEDMFDIQYIGREGQKSLSDVTNISNKDRSNDKDEQVLSGEKSDSQENFFDEQYFGTQTEEMKPMHERLKRPPKQTGRESQQTEIESNSEDNLFDEQFFGTQGQNSQPTESEMKTGFPNEMMHQYSADTPLSGEKLQQFTDRPNDDASKSIASKEDNYFDEQFFSTTSTQSDLHTAQFNQIQRDKKENDFALDSEKTKRSIASKEDNYFDEQFFSTHGKEDQASQFNMQKSKEENDFTLGKDQQSRVNSTEERAARTKIRYDYERVERRVRMDATEEDIVIMPKTELHRKAAETPVPDTEHPTTAYDMAMKIRTGETEVKRKSQRKEEVQEPRQKKWSGKLDSKGFRVLKDQTMNLDHIPDDEMLSILKDSILYEDDKIVAIDKPYDLASHGGPGIHHSVGRYLEALARRLDDPSPELHLVHRLDKYTTGVMLLAKSLEALDEMHGYFKRQEIGKIYWAITKNVPHPRAGVIDIPLAESTVGDKTRMGLRPERTEETKLLMKKAKKVRRFTAITEYNVLDSMESAALVECRTQTGIKHQIRCHLAFGMNCPILGDHKFSHFNKLAPQRLPGDMLKRLQLRQPLVRYLALHLHARSIVLPEYKNGRNMFISARLPRHFVQNMKWLKLKPPQMDGRVIAQKAGKIID